MGSHVCYIADANADPLAAKDYAGNNISQAHMFARRGVVVGWLGETGRPDMPSADEIMQAWETMSPLVLPGYITAQLPEYQQAIHQSDTLFTHVLQGDALDELLMNEPYASRLATGYSLLASSFDEGNDQEILTVSFDAIENGETVAEDLWAKASWLSFDEDDASLRFRFSFGMDQHEDVAADLVREQLAARLEQAVFPESSLIAENSQLYALLKQVLGQDALMFVERIVYFNAPNGGAQFHQDVERGHLGVVYAQVSGSTGWLALSKQVLMDEISLFLGKYPEEELQCMIQGEDVPLLLQKAANRTSLSNYLDDPDNDALEHLINRVPVFLQQLVEHGHAYILHPGDIMLLPQQDLEQCAWHSVFCLGDEAGEALSFAIRSG